MANQKITSLTENSKFIRVYKRGRSYGGKFVVLYLLKHSKNAVHKQEYINNNRLGLTATKKVGKACVRNRVRRLLFENMRLFMPSLKCGYDIVVVARTSSVGIDFFTIGNELKYLLKKADMFEKISE